MVHRVLWKLGFVLLTFQFHIVSRESFPANALMEQATPWPASLISVRLQVLSRFKHQRLILVISSRMFPSPKQCYLPQLHIRVCMSRCDLPLLIPRSTPQASTPRVPPRVACNIPRAHERCLVPCEWHKAGEQSSRATSSSSIPVFSTEKFPLDTRTLTMASPKARVLIVGTGGVGTLAAYALEIGGKAHVTAVMRSNYDAVKQNGISIDSIEHGKGIRNWRPSQSKGLPLGVQPQLLISASAYSTQHRPRRCERGLRTFRLCACHDEEHPRR